MICWLELKKMGLSPPLKISLRAPPVVMDVCKTSFLNTRRTFNNTFYFILFVDILVAIVVDGVIAD